jgi:predicted nuclease of predicted toxin-antitoxin system
MSRPRFLADHALNEHIIDGVLRREPAIEFVRARDVGLDQRPDPEILEHAAVQSLLVVSHDVNTMPSHALARLAAGQPLAGLLMARQNHPIEPIIDSLVLIWSASEAEEWLGQVRFLPI